ncbi:MULTISPECIES: ABC transporter permease DevC [unclassified Tolypothrix]|uniref:ABC transporter permease DevC n=1 Tax=unclassified Tolypothrix TaxID=2649714 RepID=UPI0005EAA4B0|nr:MULTISPECIES: ABC transporter permease DevC [unclassified Tolypothrix]BAY90116.1 heterocyst specific ABC-transporter, membrane spanning subunit DevC homolog [Microchaete diplosiphon NIES-3275]EKE97381.1 heterocyst-specific ABC superfamily ATP binding protein [Tolypothrix sp. PCC 7601]MBE9083036.1 FtsX-like permease family protein [Tolypothrix sp. LEGE 11397]UYD24331.1 FtsX-like permease family protein [Tolypothrix sp. PCC 7712]UYD33435.1 FtsX-like permease family protein [Tolypothrix sp. PC
MNFKIPLAWLQLVQQKVRFLVAVAGIAFIVLLMFIQLGFQDALYSSATAVHQSLKGDLFVVSSQYKSLTSNQSFSRTRLYQALGFDGVESVSPMYVQFAKLKNPVNNEKYSIYVIGFDPGRSVLNIPEVEENLDKLKITDMMLFDRDSRSEFGPIPERFDQGQTEQTVEIFPFNSLIGYRVRVAGLFSLGPSFGVDGNLIVSDSTFLRINPNTRPAEMIDVGVITLKPGTDPNKVLKDLQASLPNDVQVFTYQGFIDFEKQYWAVRTPIGFILSLMLTMASVVGVVIVYQILYSNIATQFVAYATLKAMGYANRYLLNVVFQQALILAVLSYIPGFIFSVLLYDFAMKATKLPIVMTFNNASLVFVSATLMCLTSGSLAINKLRSADPADIF